MKKNTTVSVTKLSGGQIVVVSATLREGGWESDTDLQFYIKHIAVPGLSKKDAVHVNLLSKSNAQLQFDMIHKTEIQDDELIIYASQLPDKDVPIVAVITKQPMTDAEIVQLVLDLMMENDGQLLLGENTSFSNIQHNLNLITEGEFGAKIGWESSNKVVIENDGTVHRPTFTEGDKAVSLVGTVSSGKSDHILTIDCNVVKQPQTNAEAVAHDLAGLTWNTIRNANTTEANVISNLTLPTSGCCGTTISWSSNNTARISNAGVVNRASTNTSVTLTATVAKSGTSQTKVFNLTVTALVQTFTVTLIPMTLQGHDAIPGTVTGGGTYNAGQTITIRAGSGLSKDSQFFQWSSSADGWTKHTLPSTPQWIEVSGVWYQQSTFMMPSNNVTIYAPYYNDQM